jgi:hypothetical protein
LALNETCFLQAIAKSGHQVGRVGKRSAAEEPNYRLRPLLRPRDERGNAVAEPAIDGALF